MQISPLETNGTVLLQQRSKAIVSTMLKTLARTFVASNKHRTNHRFQLAHKMLLPWLFPRGFCNAANRERELSEGSILVGRPSTTKSCQNSQQWSTHDNTNNTTPDHDRGVRWFTSIIAFEWNRKRTFDVRIIRFNCLHRCKRLGILDSHFVDAFACLN